MSNPQPPAAASGYWHKRQPFGILDASIGAMNAHTTAGFSDTARRLPLKHSAATVLLLLCLVATALVAPMLRLGQASGHDFQFHLASWLDAAGQWREGILYPRWAEWANWGFGEPRFIFYPPASWMAGAALGLLLPWKMAPGAFIWLTTVLAGMCMWRLAREWLPAPQAAAAAVFFAANPYHLVMIYYRADFAELLASAIFPLLLCAVSRMVTSGWQAVPAVAGIFAAVWLSNAPAAVIATYSLVLLFVVACLLRRSVWPAIYGGAAMAAGFGLAAFYILPAAWERQWVQIAQVVSNNLRPEQNFLFTHSDDPEFLLFNWKVSGVAMEVMLFAGIAAVATARLRRNFAELWWTLLTLGSASVLLMFPLSAFMWRILPELHFVQFPWRWLVPLDLVFGLFAAAAMGRLRRPWLLVAGLVAVTIGTAALIVPNAWWDSEDIPVIARGIYAGRGYEGTDEYAPITSDPYNVPHAAPLIAKADLETQSITAATGIRFHIEAWSAEHRALSIDPPQPFVLAPRLVNYPAWEVRVDGKLARARSASETGQMLVPLTSGPHQVDLRFVRTWDRRAGAAISCFTGTLLMGVVVFLRRRRSSPAAVLAK